jgi:hypothetical protein
MGGFTPIGRFRRFGRYGQTACNGLQTPPPAAATQPAFRLHVDVADFHARADAAAEEFALVHEATPDAGAGKNAE